MIKKIAGKIKGIITLGINALKLAALKIESEGKRAIDKRLPNLTLSYDEKVLLLSYKNGLCRQTNFTCSIRRKQQQNLCSKGLVKAVGAWENYVGI